MISDSGKSKPTRDPTALVLGVLTAVEQNASVTQRSMSSELGVALGLANAIFKRCVRKGLIKVSTAPLNRYAYYLTPVGFSEKARLTAEYFRVSFDLFRAARSQYLEIFQHCAARGWNRIVLIGASELAEMAILSARDANVEIVALVDPAAPGPNHCGFAVLPTLQTVPLPFDAAALCDMRDPQSAYALCLGQAALLGLESSRIVSPALLRVRKIPTVEPAAVPS